MLFALNIKFIYIWNSSVQSEYYNKYTDVKVFHSPAREDRLNRELRLKDPAIRDSAV